MDATLNPFALLNSEADQCSISVTTTKDVQKPIQSLSDPCATRFRSTSEKGLAYLYWGVNLGAVPAINGGFSHGGITKV